VSESTSARSRLKLTLLAGTAACAIAALVLSIIALQRADDTRSLSQGELEQILSDAMEGFTPGPDSSTVTATIDDLEHELIVAAGRRREPPPSVGLGASALGAEDTDLTIGISVRGDGDAAACVMVEWAGGEVNQQKHFQDCPEEL
jgi:hypothetical protein